MAAVLERDNDSPYVTLCSSSSDSKSYVYSYFNIYKCFRIVYGVGVTVQLESNSHLAHKFWKITPSKWIFPNDITVKSSP